mmetsp:Transcript_1273/g.2658  ORF Transcript_1273/g.2658 Transcript_1273/m.2658 type:complete len:568 (+) Transcript_1273:71-1774(+)
MAVRRYVGSLVLAWISLLISAGEHSSDRSSDPECPECVAPEPPSIQLLQTQLKPQRGGRESADDPLALLLRTCSGLGCLKGYVDLPDSAYHWNDTGTRLQGFSKGSSWSATVLELTSQEWLPGFVHPGEWNHALAIITPETVKSTASGWCSLYIAFGFYGSEGTPAKSLTSTDPDVMAMAELAVTTGRPAAVLFNVPAGFLSFGLDGVKIEDGEMSESEALFGGITALGNISHAAKPWKPVTKILAELPMAKAVVRAMDTISEYSVSADLGEMSRFALLGTSKRGNLCWHAAAVDQRVAAIAPFVKFLNMEGFLHITEQSLGGLPAAAKDYVKLGLMSHEFLSSPPGLWFLNVTDAYDYVNTFARLPKLVISAGNDEFMVPDHTRNWWPAVPEPKWNLMVPNSAHIVGGLQVHNVIPTVAAFFNSAMHSSEMPNLLWNLGNGTIAASLQGDVKRVKLWQATTCDDRRRDFRLHNGDVGEACKKCGVPSSSFGSCENKAVGWSSSPLAETWPGSQQWIAKVEPPSKGWTAFFIGFDFGDLQLSTEVSVVPLDFPFQKCFEAESCMGLV